MMDFILANLLYFALAGISAAACVALYFIYRTRTKQKYIILTIVSVAGKLNKQVKWDGYSTDLTVKMGKGVPDLEIKDIPKNAILPIIGRSNCYSLEFFKDSIKPFSYDFKLSKAETPKWDKKTSMELIVAKVLQELGNLGQKKIPVEILYVSCIIAGASLIACIFCINQVKDLAAQIANLSQEITKLAAGGGAVGG